MLAANSLFLSHGFAQSGRFCFCKNCLAPDGSTRVLLSHQKRKHNSSCLIESDPYPVFNGH